MTKLYVQISTNMAFFACYIFTVIGSKVLANRATVYMVDILVGAVPRAFEGRISVVLQKDAAIVYTMQCSKSNLI